MARAQDIIRCQYCEEEPALYHCVPCGDEFCSRCKTFHLKSRVPSGHNVISISEKLHPTNMVEMCESHPSKPYDACCEDCQVPVCILCIQEIHNTHRIGKMQDMYEKQKAEAMKELSGMKTQKRADVIKKIKDVENGESQVKNSHENMRREMKKQAKDFTDHITAILNEGLGESKSDEKKKLEELSQHKAELEEYQQNLEHVIEKLENLTESIPPANFILYRKQNPDVVKKLKFPDILVTTDPTFTPGKLDKKQNEKQFGQLTKIQLMRVMTGIYDSTQCAQLRSIGQSTTTKKKKKKCSTIAQNYITTALKFDYLDVLSLATDSLGHILIAHGSKYVVHLISQDGDFIAYIRIEIEGRSYPWGISIDQSDNLWLTESDNVKVYQYLAKN